MSKAYNQTWIRNQDVVQQADRWHRQGLLTDEQQATIQATYPVGFLQTNSFLEIGLFLFTTVVILAVYLLILPFASAIENDRLVYGLVNAGFGLAVAVVGAVLVNQRKLYRNGVDNAFVVIATGFIAFGLNQFIPEGVSLSTHCLLTLPLLLLVFWYYGDTLIAFLALLTFYTLIYNTTLHTDAGRTLLPYTMMLASVALYAVSTWLLRLEKTTYYLDGLHLGQWFGLSMLLISSNYYVVRELNGVLADSVRQLDDLQDQPLRAPGTLALPALFWLLTFGLPLLYLWLGTARRDRMLLILGLAGLTGAFATVHAYWYLVPTNATLTIGGLVLIGLAVLGIRHLRTPANGFTDAPDDRTDETGLNPAVLAAVQASQNAGDTPRPGNGKFGGSGAGESY
ncbi:hypothetical protein [Spirosoma rhododendri]|uniref:DUF2157 domain-containing protein n=1 Tax=Spirosoma rhododendri TaxID=2728024 RepID=A0A7L5DU06_9BACT|nr:hypothetical protein [Spirosoma rhododendri]QJD81102.1 hypothetical protein HH216_23760 [Spirosoma rhododendri]